MPAALRRLAVVTALALTWLLSAASGQAQTPPPPDPTAYMTYLPLVVQALAPPAAPNPVLVAQIGGVQYNNLTYANGYLYLITDDHLQIYDLSDPAQPRLTGQTPALGRDLYGLAVDGAYAYLGDSGVGLIVVDIRAPATPSIVATLDVPTWIGGLAARGDFVYVVGEGLTIVDVSNRAAPAIVGRYTHDDPYRPLDNGADIALAGRYAYIANDNEGALWIIDIGDPTRPTLVSNRGASLDGEAVALYDHYALVAHNDEEIGIYDVSDPTAIRQVGEIHAARSYDVFVVNDLAYVSVYRSGPVGGRGVGVYDLHNLTAPTRLAWLPFDTDAIFATDRLAFFALGTGGALIYDLGAPQTPRLLSVVGQPGYVVDVALDGPLAYVADAAFGLCVYDISNPAQPARRGWLALGEGVGPASLSASGGLVAFPYEHEIRLVDARDPTQPQLAAAWSAPGWVGAVHFLSPSLLAVASQDVYLFDVSTPSRPVAVAQVNVGAYVTHLAGAASRLVMTGWRYDSSIPAELHYLWVVDASRPDTPLVVGQVELPTQRPYDPLGPLAVGGNYAYVGHDASGLTVVDVTQPDRPLVAAALPALGPTHDLAVVGETLLATGEQGLGAVNIRAPLTPRLFGWATLPGKPGVYTWPGRIVVSGDYAFVAAEGGGLLVLKLR